MKKCIGLSTIQTRIWLDQSGILGASVDGLVGSDCVLEVKFPYTERNSTIEEAVLSKSFCLEKGENSTLCRKKDHVYWHQVQGQLYLTKRLCYFLVWTTKDHVILEITKDKEWEQNLYTMNNFYYFHLYSKVIEGEL